MRRVQKAKLIAYGYELLTTRGVPQANARVVSEIVVETEAFGVTTHGVVFFPYADEQISGELDPKAEPVLVRQRGASALIDGNNGFSQLAMRMAGEIAAGKAREQGVAMVAVRNCFWLGALGVYLVSLSRQGLLAQLWAQTSTCKDCAPFGGIEARFSTNPVAFAFPTGADPVIADFSTATMSVGRMNRMIRSGERAPEKVFRDKDGELSDDPRVVPEGGTILLLGGEHYGYKGYGMSLWCESLTALAGGDCNNPKAKTRQLFNLTVADPQAFAGNGYYLTEMKRFIGHVKRSRPLPGVPAIRLPGERGFRSLREAEADGVALEEKMIARLNELAEKYGIERI